MKREIELLAPGGDVDAIKAAIAAGANAVYCGLDKFNARNRATNISMDNLHGIVRLAHKNDCQIFITLNIIITEKEVSLFVEVLNQLINSGVDGVILQDLGMFYLLKKYFGSLSVHASTQLTTHNAGQIQFLRQLGATRVNLSRELNLKEIKYLSAIAADNDMLTEAFVHGSNCISFSGICYMSSVQSGNSGNRGRCSQPCRDKYITTAQGKDYPLNLKDNSAYHHLNEMYDAGVTSLKIEGRIKKYDYIYTVVDAYRRQLDNMFQGKENLDDGVLYKVFNRDFSNTFLKGDIHKDMFIDNPRDYSVIHLAKQNNYASAEEREAKELQFYAEKDKVKVSVKTKIDKLSIDKEPLRILVSGKKGELLSVTVDAPDSRFVVHSKQNLSINKANPLTYSAIYKRFKTINKTAFVIDHLDVNDLERELHLPFQELAELRNQILVKLNVGKEIIAPVVLSTKEVEPPKVKPHLLVLISNHKDVALADIEDVKVYFQMPASIEANMDELVDLFLKNRKLVPWFPSVIIGDDYDAANEFLQRVKPKEIVTNNTGIAYLACEKGIEWVAGPFLNITNSYSLQCLKEEFNCAGAFVSNELSRLQIKNIQKPNDFELYYSIYHPNVLMTSRQCLFHTVTGCKKHQVDDTCISHCSKSAAIKKQNGTEYIISKTKGHYHMVYNNFNFLNTAIVKELPYKFDAFLVDLSDIKTSTHIKEDKVELVKSFKKLLTDQKDTAEIIHQQIKPTSAVQYKKGI
ncbi:U32 family peptidase [Labilibacter sediminis]|nr:U32 family peptidase [Labilibacter sediminis]